jgi:hypothetical protein
MFFMQFASIYVNTIASNIAVRRWDNIVNKGALPDVVHDNVPEYHNHYLNEFPQAFLFVVCLGFFLYFDILGKKIPSWNYIRWESWCRYLECRIIMDLMRSTTVWLTNIPDPNGELVSPSERPPRASAHPKRAITPSERPPQASAHPKRAPTPTPPAPARASSGGRGRHMKRALGTACEGFYWRGVSPRTPERNSPLPP